MIPQRLFILIGALSAWLLGSFAEPHARGSLLGADGRSVPGSPEPVLVGSDTAAISGLEQREGSSGDDDPGVCVWADEPGSRACVCSTGLAGGWVGSCVCLGSVLGSRGPPV